MHFFAFGNDTDFKAKNPHVAELIWVCPEDVQINIPKLQQPGIRTFVCLLIQIL